MDYIDITMKDLPAKNKALFEKINSDYDFDLVIFVARGAYRIGLDIANFKNAPVLEIFATRSKSKAKTLLSPFLKMIPNSIKKSLRKKELNSGIHEKNSDRKISFDAKKYEQYKTCKKILLVDDSVDTGNTIIAAKNALAEYFNNAQIKVAALNIFDKAKKNVKIDYCLYENTIIRGPWSSDSKENNAYIKEYNLFHNEEVKC